MNGTTPKQGIDDIVLFEVKTIEVKTIDVKETYTFSFPQNVTLKRSKSNEITLTKFTLIRKVNDLISTAKKIDERLIIFKQKDFE